MTGNAYTRTVRDLIEAQEAARASLHRRLGAPRSKGTTTTGKTPDTDELPDGFQEVAGVTTTALVLGAADIKEDNQ